jgi:hypothetical protein
MDPQLYYRADKNSPLSPILSHHTLKLYCFQIQFNIILPFTADLSNAISSQVSDYNTVCFSHDSTDATVRVTTMENLWELVVKLSLYLIKQPCSK